MPMNAVAGYFYPDLVFGSCGPTLIGVLVG
uniref:Uncharacterized protein n=1 Tax=Arundo donax TaxID=35708 RepID=A0A0A9ATR8_ARUDO